MLMPQQINKAINPKSAPTYSIEITPARADTIVTVKNTPLDSSIGGYSDPKTGLVAVPPGENALERTIRFHEAMHSAHTPANAYLHDLLDQGLEDARLHTYCSRSATSEYQQARRDELATALRDLRKILHTPTHLLNATHSLGVLRCCGILSPAMRPVDAKLVSRVLSRFGEKADKDFFESIRLLSACDGRTSTKAWKAARAPLLPYFTADFRPDTPPPPPTPMPKSKDKTGDASATPHQAKEEKSDEKSDTPALPPPVKLKDEPDEDEPRESEPQESDEDPDTDTSEDSEDSGESEGESEADDSGDEISDSDSDSPTESKPAKSESTSASTKRVMAPIAKKSKPKSPEPVDPDLYTADLTPECDKEKYGELSHDYPLKVYIRRLDMSINRVRLSLGRRAPMPATTGRRVLCGKLAATHTPGTRVFARHVDNGGYGTILIDASGSMCIPEQALIEFLAKAPALTLAFYNAPTDAYCSTSADKTRWVKYYVALGYRLSGTDINCNCGNIFIYAANGYRAQQGSIGPHSIEHYGNGNLIDYQAIAWLIRQPAPHYLVTDMDFTGPWHTAAKSLATKLVKSKDLVIVSGLAQMQQILSNGRRK